MSDVTSVNLIKGRKPHFVDQFIGWALTVGRALVIITETIALSAFLYRFGLDRQIIDLHDKITQEQNIVNFLKNDELKFRNLQNRLQLASSIMASEGQTQKMYEDIVNFAPADMTITSLTFSSNSILLEADTRSVSSIANFTKNLKEYPDFETVSLDKIENQTTTGAITIGITATIKKPTNNSL